MKIQFILIFIISGLMENFFLINGKDKLKNMIIFKVHGIGILFYLIN